MRLLGIAIFFLALSSGGAWALEETRWLCEGEQTAGFEYDPAAGAWREGAAPPEAPRWLITRRQDVDYGALAELREGKGLAEPNQESFPPLRLVYSIQEHGSSWPVLECQGEEAFSILTCEFGDYAFSSKITLRLNTVNDRFMMVSANGYVEGSDEGGASPAITIGRCARL